MHQQQKQKASASKKHKVASADEAYHPGSPTVQEAPPPMQNEPRIYSPGTGRFRGVTQSISSITNGSKSRRNSVASPQDRVQ